MSEQARAVSSGADEIEKLAAVWIDRRDGDGWNAEDQADLESWLAQSLTHHIAFWRLNAAWKRTERLAALRTDGSREAETVERKKNNSTWARTAAALTLIALVGAATLYAMQPPLQKNYSTPIGGRQTVTLADGSMIDMNTDTAVRVSVDGKERKIWFDRGEAFFKIKHDSARPFVIVAANHLITDLGTAFSVRREASRVQIALTQGRAKVTPNDSHSGMNAVVLEPGDVAIATPNSISVSRTSLLALNNELGWRRGVLVFYNTRLADAASQFDRYSEHKILVEGTAASIRIGGTFPVNNPVAFAAIAKRILHVQVSQLGDQIVISR